MSFPGAVDEKKGKKREKVLCWRERKGWMNFAVEFHAPVVGCDEAGRSLFIPFPTPFPTMLCMWKNHFHFLTQHNCDCGTIRTESRGLDSPTHPTVCLHFCYREFYGDVSSFVLAKVWFFLLIYRERFRDDAEISTNKIYFRFEMFSKNLFFYFSLNSN